MVQHVCSADKHGHDVYFELGKPCHSMTAAAEDETRCCGHDHILDVGISDMRIAWEKALHQ